MSNPAGNTGPASLNAEDEVAFELYKQAADRIEALIGDMQEIVNELRTEVKRVTRE